MGLHESTAGPTKDEPLCTEMEKAPTHMQLILRVNTVGRSHERLRDNMASKDSSCTIGHVQHDRAEE